MTAHEYQTGGWTALVTDGALALLHPGVADDVARELWQLTTTGRRLGAWVEYLASRGIATLPSFAMVEAHPDGLRVLVRGEVDVEIAGRTVSARGYATWREEVVPAATDVTIRAAADDGGWLPLTGGIVRAAAVRLAVDQEVPAAPVEEEDDVELTVARMPALAAAVAGTSAATPAEAADAASEPSPTDASAQFGPPATGPAGAGTAAGTAAGAVRADEDTENAAAPAAEAPPAAADAGLTAAPAPWGLATPPGAPAAPPLGQVPAGAPPAMPAWLSGASQDEPPAPAAVNEPAPTDDTAEPAPASVADAAVSAPAAVPDAQNGGAATPADAAEEDPEDSDDYDFLLWSTEQVQAREQTPATRPAAPEPELDDVEPEPVPEPVDDGVHADLEATREPEPEEHGGTTGGIIDSVPGRLRPAGPPPPAPAALPTPPAAPVGVPVDLPPPPRTDDGDHDGETILAADLPITDVEIAVETVERPAPLLELVLSTGPRIELDRPVLLGRAPEAARFAGTEVPRLVSVSNPERDISSTHAEIRPAGGHVVVTDLSSTNGTVVHRPDQPPVRLQPGTGVPVGAGAVIELGTGVTVTVERPEGAQ
ncbi:FHA domain-containing protein [Georgenia satyanarayanai]|uniref:FHA domain-containing protein n=1 Tax=Georgenia satyanarayanai TaxID=860221 RepID=UPI002559D3A9|nr:FHA domain-containing protein [Georgenia satyanarayanai]